MRRQLFRIFQTKQLAKESGQVLVEFTLVLFIIMIMASGMVYTHRLLTMDYYAQQEARYLAFEQVWYSYWEANDPYGDAEDELSDGNSFRRPGLYSGLEASKEVEGDGDIDALLPLFAMRNSTSSNVTSQRKSKKMLQPAPSMLASNPIMGRAYASKRRSKDSIWHRKTKDVLKSDNFSLVRTALASQDFLNFENHGNAIQNDLTREESILRGVPRTPVEEGFIHWLEEVDFGERFCTGASKLALKHGLKATAKKFQDDECGPLFTNHAGVYLGATTDFSEVFLQMESELNVGNEPGPAFESSLEVEVARGFYSFFDTAVSAAQASASIPLGVYLVDVGLYQLGDSQMHRLAFSLDLRYMGSVLAMAAVEGAMTGMTATASAQTLGFNRSWEAELNSERTFQDLMHADALDPLGLGWGGAFTNGFYLSPEYLPVPITMVPVMGGLFDGIMHNVLTLEDDQKTDLILDSNKAAEVTYQDGNGVFSAARSRFRTSDKTLTSRFYLVTQPWHINRKLSPHGNFRGIGMEDDDRGDDADEATSEAMLKKRTFGLFMFPAEPTRLLSELTSDFPVVGDVLGAFSGVDDAFSFIKDFALGGGLGPLMDVLEFFDGVSGADFSPPRLPAARPAAYPGSNEMDGDGDLEAGVERNFQDYIDEQRDFNPKPNPKFHD